MHEITQRTIDFSLGFAFNAVCAFVRNSLNPKTSRRAREHEVWYERGCDAQNTYVKCNPSIYSSKTTPNLYFTYIFYLGIHLNKLPLWISLASMMCSFCAVTRDAHNKTIRIHCLSNHLFHFFSSFFLLSFFSLSLDFVCLDESNYVFDCVNVIKNWWKTTIWSQIWIIIRREKERREYSARFLSKWKKTREFNFEQWENSIGSMDWRAIGQILIIKTINVHLSLSIL